MSKSVKKIESADKLVESFNRLPRKPKSPSGQVANEWHFDVRYVPLEPGPSHVLAIINPGSRFIHIERLPLNLESNRSGIAFFPESSKEAAPEIARALLHSFVSNLGLNEMMGKDAPPSYAPWKFTTEERSLAEHVGNELKALGVRAIDLCKIGISKPAVVRDAREHFDGFYKGLISSLGLQGIVAASLDTPEAIIFSNFKVQPRPSVGPNVPASLKYFQDLANARPHTGNEPEGREFGLASFDGVRRVEDGLKQKPEAIVRREADEGDPEAARDYGLRLYIGLECKYDRTLARHYLVKAALSPIATDTTRAVAHGLLIWWCVDVSNEQIRSRYMLMASHHADQAAMFCRRVTGSDAGASASVLMFMHHIFERLAPTMPQLWYLYKNAIRAHDARMEQIKGGAGKMQHKRLKNPLRYRCAAVGCSIQADTGKMLQQCSGKCDPDKKPSYCSKECQKRDWKNHKPFCVPGAECSVIDDGTTSETTTPSLPSVKGSLQVPLTNPDGSRTMLSSSTLGPQMLRDISKSFSELSLAHKEESQPKTKEIKFTRDLDSVD